MRAIFSIAGLLLVLAIVGLLAKKQLSTAPVKVAPVNGVMSLPTPAPGTPPQQQSLQIQQQLRQSIDNTLQQPRPMPDEQ